MDDPNVVFKRAFAELREELGRIPTANELLGLHDAYKRAWGPAEETVLAPAAAGRPAPGGFSRQPAPQAGAIDARASQVAAEVARADRIREGLGLHWEEPLSAPRIIPTREEAVSAPKRPENKPGAAERLIEGDRGPSGGLMCKCQACGRLWERERRRGRPAFMCEECR